jgi:DNA-binding Xre family transcriptional regulator
MLYLNVGRVMSSRGILQRYAYLTKNGFIRSTASKLASNQTWQIRYSLLEQLCLVLNCTPNDLFQWLPDENQQVGENTALKILIRNEKESAISQIVKDIPFEKLERAKELLAQLKDE